VGVVVVHIAVAPILRVLAVLEAVVLEALKAQEALLEHLV
jgi:hypothetical protein